MQNSIIFSYAKFRYIFSYSNRTICITSIKLSSLFFLEKRMQQYLLRRAKQNAHTRYGRTETEPLQLSYLGLSSYIYQFCMLSLFLIAMQYIFLSRPFYQFQLFQFYSSENHPLKKNDAVARCL